MNLNQHPCFNSDSKHKYARVHLPVAPRCNVQCNFCNRKFDCMNESRPGVTSVVLTPQQAVAYTESITQKIDNLSVVGIAGPGDPFANPEETMQTLRLVREKFPEILLCVASNGLSVGPYIKEMADLKVSHVTITLNAIDPEIGAKIYSWVREGKRPYRGIEGATILLERQLQAIRDLKAHGITVKINTILMPGINLDHIEDISKKVSELGADIMNGMPLIPVEGAVFEDLDAPNGAEIARARIIAQQYLPQMTHCARCRADAVGLIGENNTEEQSKELVAYSKMPNRPDEYRPYVAVASHEGMLVNQHLGEANRLLIYERKEDGYAVVEIRKTPEEGIGSQRWVEMAKQLNDCTALLVAAVGPKPLEILKNEGLRVVEMEGMIDDGLEAVFAGMDVPAAMQRQFKGCGTGCQGTGTGCG